MLKYSFGSSQSSLHLGPQSGCFGSSQSSLHLGPQSGCSGSSRFT